MEPQRRAGNVWTGLIDRLVTGWRFALGARRALGAEPVEATVGDVLRRPEVAAARRELAARVPAQVHGFRRPVLVLNPRSGSAQAVRERLLAAAGRYGVQLHEAELPFVCVPAGTRNHVARDLGLDRADPTAAIEAFVAGPERRVDVASVGDRLFLNNASIGIYAALVHEPSYRDNQLGALSGVLESMLERDALPVRVSFRDGFGNHWDQVLVLFVSNNAYPLSDLGGRPRLDAGMLEVSALRRTEGQELGRALENLFNSRYQAGQGWARWATTSLEVDTPSGRLEVGIDGEPAVVDTPVEFKIHAGALRVLLPPSRPASGRPATSRSAAPRRRVLAVTSTPEGRREQLMGLVRLGRLLGRVGERDFGPERDERGRAWPGRRR